MIRCVQCNEVSGIKKAGRVRNKQRYYCNHCNLYFSLPETKETFLSRPSNITLKDIAEQTGYSTSTVSKALNNHPDISPDKKAAILAKAEELDYQPNKLASSLKKQKTLSIGMVVPEFTQSYYPQVILEINKKLTEAGYTLYITQSGEQYANEVNNIQSLLANRVDGIIGSVTFETKNFAHFQKVIDRKIPLVLFSRYPNDLACPKVKVNDFSGAYTIVKHLIEKGFKKVAHIGGPDHISVSYDRYNGYVQALKDYNLPIKENWIIRQPDVIPNAKKYAQQLLHQEDRPDAIFAFTDPVAISIIEVAREMNIRIPQQLGVAGFSDDPVSRHITPGITTMRQPFAQIAEQVVNNLLLLIKNGYAQTTYSEELAEAVLIIRESSNKQ